MNLIAVQMADARWTLEAMHYASALARRTDGKVLLLHLTPVANPGLLGWGIAAPTEEEEQLLTGYATVAEDYGVPFCIQPLQYLSPIAAVIQAAAQLQTDALFAHLPESRFHLWRRFQRWNLKRQLGSCRLYLLEDDEPRLH